MQRPVVAARLDRRRDRLGQFPRRPVLRAPGRAGTARCRARHPCLKRVSGLAERLRLIRSTAARRPASDPIEAIERREPGRCVDLAQLGVEPGSPSTSRSPSKPKFASRPNSRPRVRRSRVTSRPPSPIASGLVACSENTSDVALQAERQPVVGYRPVAGGRVDDRAARRPARRPTPSARRCCAGGGVPNAEQAEHRRHALGRARSSARSSASADSCQLSQSMSTNTGVSPAASAACAPDDERERRHQQPPSDPSSASPCKRDRAAPRSRSRPARRERPPPIRSPSRSASSR